MNIPETTCWTVIEGAAAGRDEDREQFARTYAAAVRSYFEARWGKARLIDRVDDAVQEVFVECFRQEGVLERVDGGEIRSFRRFLFGLVRNVALRIEDAEARATARRASPNLDLDAIERDESTLSTAFDRAWARSTVREAVAIQLAQAEQEGEDAEKRVELLHLRFYDGLPVREIARRWGADPAKVHRAYARARREFQRALMRVVEFHNPGAPEDAEREFEEILAVLA